MNNKTGILFFSKSPQHEAKLRKLSACREDNRRIWHHLYNHSLAIAKSTCLPVLICDSPLQSGNTFAERFLNAIDHGFKKGFQHLIVIGSDCPGLSQGDIHATATYLNNGNDIVAGPDHRGGLYLFGITKNAFNREKLLQLGWQTPNLFFELKEYAADLKFIAGCTVRYDIHSHADALQSLSDTDIKNAWCRLVLKVFLQLKSIFQTYFVYIKSQLEISNLSLRAPPPAC